MVQPLCTTPRQSDPSHLGSAVALLQLSFDEVKALLGQTTRSATAQQNSTLNYCHVCVYILSWELQFNSKWFWPSPGTGRPQLALDKVDMGGWA